MYTDVIQFSSIFYCVRSNHFISGKTIKATMKQRSIEKAIKSKIEGDRNALLRLITFLDIAFDNQAGSTKTFPPSRSLIEDTCKKET